MSLQWLLKTFVPLEGILIRSHWKPKSGGFFFLSQSKKILWRGKVMIYVFRYIFVSTNLKCFACCLYSAPYLLVCKITHRCRCLFLYLKAETGTGGCLWRYILKSFNKFSDGFKKVRNCFELLPEGTDSWSCCCRF